ncbi:MAG: tyrosine--tRNA ligase [Candidatus Buchananbacteria bacterium RIFCSPLOWO2_01_FULL_46_12]|uniref:Tyrosine--tRNA ligase n=2 Tax=Candidatus Buchananiibacteriota TaxID=1817903 RepID=A0A1G1YSZ5_9BACT|nr:MAG: tyrosine--tRNA ligase [Candidatus Buchananbacteria bacterium RIFCSPHIGHO2_01_FULL_44_11]OGY55475.1 MAG: tyrosine--tRNA ligase [Candidatus Buchananbacteria bacterium RIFCSPLOWO2_01_FULL_46_12]
MAKPDEKKINELLTRGVEAIYPSRPELEKVLRSGKKLRLYHGIDPTGPTLHLGHLVQLLKLRQFQDLNHEVIILIGDFTATIGDPSDQNSARKILTRQQVLKNSKDYKSQIYKILDQKKVIFRYNSEWLDKLKFEDLIKLSSQFTAQQTLARSMFKKRMAEGKDLYINEFLYPVFQAYDSVVLDVDLEIGGNDQMFNMLAGRTLMKKTKNKEKFVLTTKLLEDPTGKKMGKTTGNMVSLADQPTEVYGKIMSWPDSLILTGFELITQVPLAEINQLKADLAGGRNPKLLKMLLAYELIQLYWGKSAAIKAEESFKQVFEEKLNPDEIKIVHAKSKNIIDVLEETKLASSKSEARRLISQGGIRVDGKVVKDQNFEIGKIDQDGVVIQKGKRHFVKIK